MTTCVQYDDFLAATLPINKVLFDHFVVVTSPEDEATQKLCEYWHVECRVTNAFGTERGEFNKGCAINVGLRALAQDGWVVHLDADVALPPETRRLLDRTDLDPTMLYGIDRYKIPNAKKWAQHLTSPRLQHEASVYIHTEQYPICTRFMSPAMGGWLPIGFFQMWNPEGSGVTRYSETHSTAGRTDMLFADNWRRSQRVLLPEIVGYHLESESGVPQGANWSGRTTKRFEIKSRWSWTPAMCWRRWRHRRHHHHHHHHPHPYWDDVASPVCPTCGISRSA